MEDLPEPPAPEASPVKAAVALADAARWPELLALTADPALVRAHPHLLVLRALAARVLHDPALIADVLARCAAAAPDLPAAVLFGVSREFSKGRYCAEGWAALRDQPRLREEVGFINAAGRLRALSPDRALRLDIGAALRAASGGGFAQRGRPAGIAFPPAGPPGAHTTPELLAAPGTAPRHMAELARLQRQFAAALARPAVPEVFEFRDVFTDRHGQVWDGQGRILRHYAKPIADLRPKEAPYLPAGLLMSSAALGFYHWLVDRVPMLAWLMAPGAVPAPLLLGEGGRAYEGETLDLLGLPTELRRHVGEAIFCRRLLVARVGFAGMSNWGHVAPLMERLVGAARAQSAGQAMPRRLYVSRRDASRRRMRNEAALEEAMLARGITPVLFAAMPLRRQIALVAQAEVIVAPHGAGLAHLLLARPGTRVFEILPIEDGTYNLRFNFARLSMMRGLAYSAWVQEVRPRVSDQDWALDLPRFLDALDARLPV